MGALKELSFEFKGRLIAVDDDCYLVNPDDWSEELAEYLTLRAGLTLTDDHWEVIRFICLFLFAGLLRQRGVVTHEAT